MARPIKETPVLKGNDAVRFEKAIKANEAQKVPAEQYKRAIEIHRRIIEQDKS